MRSVFWFEHEFSAKPSQIEMRMYTYIAAGGKQINVELKKQ